MKTHCVGMKGWLLAALAGATLSAGGVIGCAAQATVQVGQQPSGGIERWARNHPPASQALGEWVRVHPQAAAMFFQWDGQHPAKAKEFVTWTIYNPGAPIDVFVATHPGWPTFDQISMNHRPAADAFMVWCRRHPQAAEALMNHPHGLEWAGHHLYAGYWQMEAH
jgi:hypothetical protein